MTLPKAILSYSLLAIYLIKAARMDSRYQGTLVVWGAPWCPGNHRHISFLTANLCPRLNSQHIRQITDIRSHKYDGEQKTGYGKYDLPFQFKECESRIVASEGGTMSRSVLLLLSNILGLTHLCIYACV